MDLLVLDMLAQASPGLFGATGLGTLGLYGGGIGAVVGGIAGLIQAQQARRDASRTRRRLRRAQAQAGAEARNITQGILAGPQQTALNNFLGGIFGFQPQTPQAALGDAFSGAGVFTPREAGGSRLRGHARQRAVSVGKKLATILTKEQRVRAGFGSERELELIQARVEREAPGLARAFEEFSGEQRQVALSKLGGFSIQDIARVGGAGQPQIIEDVADPSVKPVSAGGTSGGAALNPLAVNVQRGVEQALATRGLSGGRAAAFTSGLAGGFQNFQTQLSLLPFLSQQSVFPTQLSQGIAANRFSSLAAPILQSPFGPSALSGSAVGGLAGFGAGSSIGLNLAKLASRERGGGDTAFDGPAQVVDDIALLQNIGARQAAFGSARR